MKLMFQLAWSGVLVAATSPSAMAACSSSTPATGTTVTCSGNVVSPVIAQTGSTGVVINADSTTTGSFVHATAPVAFSVDTSSTITGNGNLSLAGGGGTGGARGAVILGTGDNNQLTNGSAGIITTSGAFNDGMAANGSDNIVTNNGTITTTGPNAYGMTAAWGQTNLGQSNNSLINTGTVSTAGSNARAASILGGSGTIINSGVLSTAGAASPTAYMQGNNDHLINSGSITATGARSDAVFSNTVGSSFTALIENGVGGQIISANASGIRSLNGNTTIINAGLVQSGVGTAISMGNGNDSLILQTGSFINGGADGGAGANTVTLQGSGTAANDFNSFQTLQMQGALWNWTGSGNFTLANVKAGTLNLTGTLGIAAQAVVDAGATLQANALNMPQSVTDNGLVRFSQDSDGTYGGIIAGTGTIEKTGNGTLNWTGSGSVPLANVKAGTLNLTGTLGIAAQAVVDAGATLQANALNMPQSVTDNGLVRFSQDSDGTYGGIIAGTGTIEKTGNGTLTLNSNNPYSGGTAVTAGTLAVGDARHRSAALSGGGATTVTSGATLGGYGSVTGNVTNNGTIAVANALAPFSAQANGSFAISGLLTNAGLAQIGGQNVGNILAVGSYSGQNGILALNTYVGGDGAASDKLVINGGTATGSSTIKITNVDGPGAATLANGITVVQATNGASTQASAFTLAAPVKAGAYQYYLAKGGVTAGTVNNWYLRNSVVPSAAGSPAPAGVELPTGFGTLPLPPAPAAGADPIPLYRAEVPVYAATPAVARQLGMMQVDGFHDRQGEQSALTETGALPTAWGRVWGGHSTLRQTGDAAPTFDGTVFGAQAGQDIYADKGVDGQRNHYGVFVGFGRATGDVSGFALGVPDLNVGHLAVEAYSLGAYWTHIGKSGWYTDAVVMGSALDISASSRDGAAATTHGTALSSSFESGIPISLDNRFTLEPQVQLIWQHLSISDLDDDVSSVSFNSGNTFLARLGVRLSASVDAHGRTWQPYFKADVLRSFGTDDSTTFGGVTPIGTSIGQTSGRIGVGVQTRIMKQGHVFVAASYAANLGGERQRTVKGNAGVRWAW